jgi:seryl-tRNA synthetase
MELSEPVLALLAAIFGGAGLKLIEALLAKSTRRQDVAKEIRDELRSEIVGLKVQLGDIERRLDRWKRQYYELYVAFNELVVVALSAGLTEETNRIRRSIEDEDEQE